MTTNATLSYTPRFPAITLALTCTLVPNPHLLDALYPLSPFLLHGERVELCMFPQNLPAEGSAFYADFRQDGGKRPIFPFANALPAAQNEATANGQTLLVALHTGNGLAAAARLERGTLLPPLLLLAAEQVYGALPPLYAAGYTGHCVIRLSQGGYEESFCFVSPNETTAGLVHAFESAGKMVATDLKVTAQAPDAEVDTVVIYLPGDYETWSSKAVTPLTLVHDGNRAVEGDAAYSWLWYAGRNQLRMLLGPVAQHYRRLRVILPNAMSTTNLRGARLLLNGESVQPHVELWSDTSGALSVELPDNLVPPLVVGVWVPEGTQADDGMTKLFACIDRVELSA